LPPSDLSERQQIIAAFLALLAERPFEEIGFSDIASRAGFLIAFPMRSTNQIATATCHRPTNVRRGRAKSCTK